MRNDFEEVLVVERKLIETLGPAALRSLIPDDALQAGPELSDFRNRCFIGLQVPLVVGQKVAVLTNFCILHKGQQPNGFKPALLGAESHLGIEGLA